MLKMLFFAIITFLFFVNTKKVGQLSEGKSRDKKRAAEIIRRSMGVSGSFYGSWGVFWLLSGSKPKNYGSFWEFSGSCWSMATPAL
jgi:hypothetical protein